MKTRSDSLREGCKGEAVSGKRPLICSHNPAAVHHTRLQYLDIFSECPSSLGFMSNGQSPPQGRASLCQDKKGWEAIQATHMQVGRKEASLSIDVLDCWGFHARSKIRRIFTSQCKKNIRHRNQHEEYFDVSLKWVGCGEVALVSRASF